MRFSTVTIFKTDSGEVVREIKLQPGVNFIVDETTEANDTTGNNVGKTTFLKLINILMGATDKKFLYLDKDTGNLEVKLRDRIENDKLAVSAELVSEGVNEKIRLEVELFERGKHRINGEQYAIRNYNLELNRILFGNNLNVPTFRQLIQAFVRVKMDSENDKFLKYLEHTTTEQYRAIYNYLFETADSTLDIKRNDLKSSLKKIEDAAKEFKKIDSVGDTRTISQIISSIHQMIESVEREVSEIELQLANIINSKVFLNNKDRIQDVRRQYSELTDEIAELSFKQMRHTEAVQAIQNESLVSTEDKETKKFFDEIKGLIPNVTKTFDELVAFNQKIQRNKIHYLQTVISSYNRRIAGLKTQQTELIETNGDLMSIVTDDNLSRYEKLSRDLSDRRAELITLTNKLEEYSKFQTRIKDLKSQLAVLREEQQDDNSTQKSITQKMVEFNSYFTAYSEKLNGERPYLVYDFQEEKNAFPIHVEALGGLSKGTKKAMVAAYDLAYQSFAKENDKLVPHFIIHDVMENIDGTTLQNLIELVNTVGSQFIFAVLKEKLVSSGIDNGIIESHSVLSLSKEKRLFGD
ncbi:DUF2326 domain-containing protein [Weissella cibaria]|uniref:DUF2326 domain-containing protein n=1 Tax=Weissella cibaria TaxID=137591 RepID=UPI00211EE864|nr:DUF2326 domain-containing protein [Weissella cibaria]MCQ9619243.1 DUF2326 domain-containing protein [Weissella cibaria]